mgnify:FL=1
MTYIKLEDVQKILHQMDGTPLSISQATDDINSLQSISPESMIEEMIDNLWVRDYEDQSENILKELLQRFKS